MISKTLFMIEFLKKGRMVAITGNEGEKYDQPTVGLIVPPPEIRSIVEKTASFVARNGEQFEQKIKQNEAANPKDRFNQFFD